ncbi:ATP-binding protein [Streptomyces sp. NPDC003016]
MATVSPPAPWAYAFHLPRHPRAPRVARMTLRAVLGGHGTGELIDVAELLTSEVVTNSYRHSTGGRGLLLVRLCADKWGGCPIGAGPGGKLLWFELGPPKAEFAFAA